MDIPISLVDRLRESADLWSASHGVKPSRLGRLVKNDGGFFDRLASAGSSTTTASLEQFARFLTDPEQWPDGKVPEAVRDFAHVVGVSGAGGYPSPDSEDGDIGNSEGGGASASPGRGPAADEAPASAAELAGPLFRGGSA